MATYHALNKAVLVGRRSTYEDGALKINRTAFSSYLYQSLFTYRKLLPY
jgi:hypothetical protein